MKKLTIFLVIATMSVITTSCHFGRHTRIVETGTNHYLSIESYGKVYFNHSGTEVVYVSRGGYLRYKNDSKELRAENDHHGGVKYELIDYGQKLEPNSNRAFIADAIRVMIAKGYNPN
jgi:hypothetical protein